MKRRGHGRLDAIVVGSGPNGLAAAIELARAGRSVVVAEANEAIGGGARSDELTLPGFVHDVCSAIHPLAVGSPYLRRLPLEQYGLRWIHPDAPLAHPLDDRPAAMLERSLNDTAALLGDDGIAWRRLFGPGVRHWDELADGVLGPLRLSRLFANPVVMARFGLTALASAQRLCEGSFRDAPAKALFAGMAAHSMLQLERVPSAAFGLLLGLAGHAVGWPLPRGGAGAITAAMGAYLRSLGGEIVTGWRVRDLDELPPAGSVLFDVTPRQLLSIAGAKLPARYREALEAFRYGPGAFKLDWALSEPIPWADPQCARAGTVHLGGDLDEIAEAERAPWQGRTSERPFVLLAQPSRFDPTRAPAGKHTAWAYCHVPGGSSEDMTGAVEAQIERFAPGFRARIVGRHTTSPPQMERENANRVGGDINGGVQDLGQLFTRPARRLVPYSTPLPGVYICSSSTPPGGGVHGMCGYYAAVAALRGLP